MKWLCLFLLTLLSAGVASGGLTTLDHDHVQELLDDGAYEEASALLAGMVKHRSASARTFYLQCTADLMLGDFEEAEKWCEKALDRDKDNPEYWTRLGNIRGMRARAGSKLKALGRAKGARKAYDRALELDPAHPVALLSKFRYKLYAPGFVGGDKEEARRLAERLLAADPALGHIARAQIFLHADENVGAYHDELRLARTAAREADICYEIAGFFLADGNLEDAWSCYERGIELEQDPERGKILLARSMLGQGLLDEAEAVLQAIDPRGPLAPRAALGLAMVAKGRGQDEMAWQGFQNVVEAYPEFPPGKYFLGEQYLLTREEPGRAVPLLEEYLAGHVRQSWPPRWVAHWRLAVAHEKLRDYGRALKSLEKAEELGADGDDFKRDRRRIEFMAED
jgi:tetratricopeptide (TPR) repeat protein